MNDPVSELTEGRGEASDRVVQRVVASGSSQVAALGSGTQIVNFISSREWMPPVPAMVLNSLPGDVSDFVDREDVLERITASAARIEQASPMTTVLVIDGMAGVGKTALAVRAAHRLGHRFPDGQLYLDLHAHSRGRTPVEPAHALETLLRVTGIPGQEIPDSLDGRIAMWRSRTADQSILMVLDNAATSQQVRPLLPASSKCLVLVASRQQLAGLNGSLRVGLRALVTDDAVKLFVRIVGAERVEADSEAVRQIIESCARLPLALTLCAARLRCRSSWSAQNLVAELAGGPDRLGSIRAESESIVEVFEMSYQGLDPQHQRTFRRLGLHPAQDFSADAAAALDGADPREVRQRLEALCDQNLVQELRYGRYKLHDLLHEFAHRMAQAEDSAAEHSSAIDRLLDFYTSVATRADAILDLLGSRNMDVQWTPASAPGIDSHTEAINWMENERTNLHSMVRIAVGTDRHARAVRLVRTMIYFLRLRGYWGDALELCQRMAPVCDEVGDRTVAADLRFFIGDVLRLRGDRTGALQQYQAVLTEYRTLADRYREARTLHSIGDLDRAAGHNADAIDHYQAALAAYRDLDSPRAEARAIHSIADTYRLSGRHSESVDEYRRVLPIYQALDDPVGVARVHHALGEIHRITSEYEQALADCGKALTSFELLGDRLGEADAHLSLGDVHEAYGHHAASLRHFRRARQAYLTLGDQHGYARALWRFGRVLISSGHVDAGIVVLRDAVLLLERHGTIAEVSQARADLGTWDGASGAAR